LLNKLIKYVIILLNVLITPKNCRKDVKQVFYDPVTDDIAPGYSEVIKHPMDFYTMKAKLRNGEYKSLKEFQVIGPFKILSNV
jgi:hypothetical protein